MTPKTVPYVKCLTPGCERLRDHGQRDSLGRQNASGEPIIDLMEALKASLAHAEKPKDSKAGEIV
jgi:non-homologous end joining protein Ku